MVSARSVAVSVLLLAGFALAQAPELKPVASEPWQKWKQAILAGDTETLKAMYVSLPPAQLADARKQPISLDAELNFWKSRKAEGLKELTLEVVSGKQPPANLPEGFKQVVLDLELKTQTAAGLRTTYLSVVQLWTPAEEKQPPQISAMMRSNLLRLKPVRQLNPNLYPAGADAKAELKEALERAAHEHKRVLLVFGGNWCYDCHVLDSAFRHPEIKPLLEANYILVHVDIGHADKNLDIVKLYDVVLDKGVPTLAVLETNGKLVFRQQQGEFESARSLGPEEIIEFLNKWKSASKS